MLCDAVVMLCDAVRERTLETINNKIIPSRTFLYLSTFDLFIKQLKFALGI